MIVLKFSGDLNEEIEEFERHSLKEEKTKPVATHMLTFMARGIKKRFNYPIGYYASVGFNSDQLFNCFWEAVKWLEYLSFKVRVAVCDGASPNRRFFKIHLLTERFNLSEDGVVYRVMNRYIYIE